MTMQIRMEHTGAPEVLAPHDVALPEPGAGEVRVRHTAVGVNFLDVYFRRGDFTPPSRPFVNGFEAAGVIEAAGPATRFAPGDRVGYTLVAGSYAEARVMPQDRLVSLPDHVDDALAAALLLKGSTAEFLLHRAHRVHAGDRVLVHAAAGGVGSLLCRWASALGAEVIGTVGSAAKVDAALANGCTEVIDLERQDFVERTNALTGDDGVDVVYDGVGAATFHRSFGCLARMGHNVLFGWSSGRVEPLDVNVLNDRSHRVSNPSLGHYSATAQQRGESAERLFGAVRDAGLSLPIAEYALEEASRAHADLEGRRTAGAVVLRPAA